ncbi:MAG: TetR family transcriptional regulator [Lachnospiraceae bacterium]|nr:TetR family transcriptional regulator [Lachnospiraceae bacterium]
MPKLKNDMSRILADSFLELIMTNPINKITIKQITDNAGVIRTTFYNHFQDKYQLVEYIISEDLLKPIQPLIQNKMWSEAILLVLTTIENNKVVFSKIAKIEGQDSFEVMAERQLKDIIVDVMETNGNWNSPSEYIWITPERIAKYYAKIVIYIVKEWIEGGFEVSPQDIVHIHEYFMTKNINDFLFNE